MTISLVLNSNIMNEGMALIFKALYAPVIDPGFRKYAPLC